MGVYYGFILLGFLTVCAVAYYVLSFFKNISKYKLNLNKEI